MGFLGDLYNKRVEAVERRKRRERSSKRNSYRNKAKPVNNNYARSTPPHYNFADPTPRFPSLKGELVRSLSEKYIADFLYTHQIRYEYEKEIRLDGYSIKPDFFLPTYNVYIEFWGLLDSNDPQYWKSFRWKTQKYSEHNIKFVPLRSYDLPNLITIFPQKLQQALRKRD